MTERPYRIEFAPELDPTNPNYIRLMRLIGRYVAPERDDWMDYVVSSTESQIMDFFYNWAQGKDSQQQIAEIGKELGLDIDRKSYIWEIVAELDLRKKREEKDDAVNER